MGIGAMATGLALNSAQDAQTSVGMLVNYQAQAANSMQTLLMGIQEQNMNVRRAAATSLLRQTSNSLGDQLQGLKREADLYSSS